MASIPQATFSAIKVHEHLKQKYEFPAGEDDGSAKGAFRTTLFGMDPVLPNYNSKLMNSIWGQYNLYASHAFQKNSEGSCMSADFFNVPQVKNLWDFIRSPH